MPDDLRAGLRSLAGSVRPTPAATGLVHRAVRRRRRLRTGGWLAGVAAAVTVISVGAAAVSGGGPVQRDPAQQDPAQQNPAQRDPLPAASPSATPAARGSADVFSCARESKVFTGDPQIPDLAAQQQIVDTLLGLSSVQVRHAEPTALGVVALVVDASGDQDHLADPEVVTRLEGIGASHVYEWDPSMAEAGVDAAGQVHQVLGWVLDPVVREVRRSIRGIPGDAGLALWTDRGAVLLQWKEPIPTEIQSLARVRKDGVRVIVEGVPYSQAEVQRATDRLSQALRAGELLIDFESWSMSHACADGSGLIVGLVPEVIGDRVGELQEELARVAKMPVLVVAEERTVELGVEPPRIERR